MDGRFNENYYLNDEYYINSFYSDNYFYRLREEVELKENIDVIKKYDLFISKLARFIKRLGYTSTLECSMIISYMIRNGYLSNNMIFLDDESKHEEEIDTKLGINIICGYGCCRNYVALHKDVFDNLNLYMKKLYCYEGFGKGINKGANHVISLLKFEGQNYGIDLYNGDRLYRFKNEFDLEEIADRTKFKLRYKPYMEIIIDGSTIEEIRNNLVLYKDLASEKVLNPFEYEDIIDNSKDALYDFHQENSHLLRKVNDIIYKK